MGGSISNTRKLTVENDDPTSVIKVSEEVIDRIRGSQVVRNEIKSPVVSQGAPAIAAPLFLHEPNLTSLQLRQANVAELKKNDEYWENRMQALEENHKKMNEVMEQEYNKAMEELQGKKTPVVAKIVPPCQDTKKAVLECYKCYPNEPMRCAQTVQAFQECVDLKRACIMAGRG